MKVNVYQSLGQGIVVANDNGMQKLYQPKVKIASQIMRLSAATIAECFGVVGKAYIEGIRCAMLDDLIRSDKPVASWRQVADRVKGISAHEMIG